MKIIKTVKSLSIVTLLSIGLAGCLGESAPKFEKITTFNDFYNEVYELKNSLMMENPSLAGKMELSLLKLAAFDGFDVEQIDLRKGLVIPDILSVLPPDNISQLTAAYSVLGNKLYEGITVQEIVSLSNQREQEIYDAYNQKVMNLLTEIDAKIASVSQIIDNNKAVMRNISMINPTLIVESKSSFNQATLNGEILNGTSSNVIAFEAIIKAIDEKSMVEVATSRVGVSYERQSLNTGETRVVRENLPQAALTQLEPGTYSVVLEVIKFTNDVSQILSNEEAILALNTLKIMKRDTTQYQSDLLGIINSSFDGAYL